VRWHRVVFALCCCGCAAPQGEPASLTSVDDRVVVALRGEPFCDYRFTDRRSPVLWPLRAPGGIAVTRAFPLAELEGEPRDRRHHESCWFAHGLVNGVDFWQGDGRIVERDVELDGKNGAVHGVGIWQKPDGSEVCRDVHRFAFSGEADWRAVDVDVTLVASNGELVLGDTREGTFALRLRRELSLREGGSVVNSEGDSGALAFGKPARWVAATAELHGQLVVVALFDHPQNHGHPARWQARDYGLLAANPFALHEVAGAGPGAGAVTLPAGGKLRLRYRVFLGRGRAQLDGLDAAWEAWVERSR
jgi:hypothetical protein